MNNPNYVGPDIAKEMHDVLSKAVYNLKGISPIPDSEPIVKPINKLTRKKPVPKNIARKLLRWL